jgi:hypothetical protein
MRATALLDLIRSTTGRVTLQLIVVKASKSNATNRGRDFPIFSSSFLQDYNKPVL